jgi:hypothetical protein
VLDALSAPEYAKFLRYADKLRTWDAVKSTVDEGEAWQGAADTVCALTTTRTFFDTAGVKERYKAVLTKKE